MDPLIWSLEADVADQNRNGSNLNGRCIAWIQPPLIRDAKRDRSSSPPSGHAVLRKDRFRANNPVRAIKARQGERYSKAIERNIGKHDNHELHRLRMMSLDAIYRAKKPGLGITYNTTKHADKESHKASTCVHPRALRFRCLLGRFG